MYNVGDQVRVKDTYIYPQLATHIGIVTYCEAANNIVNVAMYDILIGHDTYVFYDDELSPVVTDTIGAH